MSGTTNLMRVALVCALITVGCGGEPTPAPTGPVAPASGPGGPAPSLAEWLPEGHPGASAQAHAPHSTLPPGHPPIEGAAPSRPGLPAGHPPMHDEHEEAVPETTVAGTVRETMNAAGYTYMHVETAAGMRWVAGTQTTVAVGDQVHAVGTTMHGFRSGTLDRTFDQLVLASSVRVQ